ncbi:MAG TPA: chromosome segregation protein SMC [Sulfurospirillum sp. UBA11407]|nr:MAG TPA: chromosome segregation protein SMC [Sulfurospirillum sp. UBA11407]
MILTKLSLENFKRYSSYEIEFGEGLTGIIGKNGSGKSTLFEALLVALYGEPKQSRGFKENLRNANATSKDAVSVVLEFEFESATYKVQREFRGKNLTTNAKLYKNGELTTSGSKEVTEAIIKLTKMSKDAFMHTLFSSQKELASLSGLKNEERKKMIRRLLGLAKIDFIENLLVEKSRELKREIEKNSAEFLLSAEDIKEKENQIKENQTKKEELSKSVQAKLKEIEALKKQESEVKKELEVFAKTKDAKQKAQGELKLAQNSLESTKQNELKLGVELKSLEEKAKELAKLASVKKEYLKIQDEVKKQEELKNIHIKKEALEKEQLDLREQYTKTKADIKTLELTCKEYEPLSKKVKELEELLNKLKTDLTQKQNAKQKLSSELWAEQRVVNDTKEKISAIQKLGRESKCPTCTRALLDEYDHVIASLSEIVSKTQTTKIASLQKELEALEKELNKAENEKSLKEKEFLKVSNELNLVQSKQKDLESLKAHFVKVSDKGKKNKEELAKLSTYSYDEALHVKIKESFEKLKAEYEKIVRLEEQVQRIGQVKTDLELTCKRIESLHEQIKTKDTEVKNINYDEAKHGAKQKELDKVQEEREKHATLLSELQIEIAKNDSQVKTLQNDLSKNAEALKKVQKKKDDLSDYEKIKISLSEFKTKLNAKVAPRISGIASDMYSTITKGKYQHIEVNNDFDFFIYDEGVKYPIERFSGGEIDLANLVLRIAISKTLSELSGASSVGFLAFDEVFGSQDEGRRMEILEAFHTIKEQYRQIFLISHEMEIKEMFERVVEL